MTFYKDKEGNSVFSLGELLSNYGPEALIVNPRFKSCLQCGRIMTHEPPNDRAPDASQSDKPQTNSSGH